MGRNQSDVVASGETIETCSIVVFLVSITGFPDTVSVLW